MTEIEESAKAIAETAKFGSQALSTGEKLGSFLNRVFGGLVTDAVGVVGDRVKFFRWHRQVRLADKVNQILIERGVNETREVPPKIALPLLEAATLEDNDDLQTLWAQLLANAMDPSFKSSITLTFVSVLRELTAPDVRILNSLYGSFVKAGHPRSSLSKIYFEHSAISAATSIHDDDYYMSIYSLFRAQCLEPAQIGTPMATGAGPITFTKGAEAVAVTHFGAALVEACLLYHGG